MKLKAPPAERLRQEQVLALFVISDLRPISRDELQREMRRHYSTTITDVRLLVKAMPGLLQTTKEGLVALTDELRAVLRARQRAIDAAQDQIWFETQI